MKMFQEKYCEQNGVSKYDWKKIVLPTKEEILIGIQREQAIWTPSDPLLDKNGFNSARHLKDKQNCWRLIFEQLTFSDDDIYLWQKWLNKRLINDYMNYTHDNMNETINNVKKSIIRLYTLETELCYSVNTALCTKDFSKSSTLGPFIIMLDFATRKPTKDSLEILEGLSKNEVRGQYDFNYEYTELNRGVRIPESAIELYKAKIGKGKIRFNGFTSTSVKRKQALEYAYKTENDGKVPCLFVLKNYGSSAGVYLYNEDYSAFPTEKEVLIGYSSWFVESVEKENSGLWVIRLQNKEL